MSKLINLRLRAVSLYYQILLFLATMFFSITLNNSNILGLLFLLLLFSLNNTQLEFAQKFALKSISFCLLTGLTYTLPLSNTIRYGFGSLVVLLIHAFSQNWRILPLNLRAFSASILSIEILYILIKSTSDRFLQFLIYGYDNAFHFSLFRIYMTSENYSDILQSNWTTDFELFRNYPGGFYAIGSTLASIIVGDTEDPINLLSAYFLILLILFLAIFFLSICLIKPKGIRDMRDMRPFAMVLPLVTSTGILLTNGYPPYLYSLLILLFLAILLLQEKRLSRAVVYTSICLHLLLISQPLVSLNLLTPLIAIAGYFLFKFIRGGLFTVDYLAILFGSALGLITFYLVSNTNDAFGIETLKVVGGVQPLTVAFWAIQFVLALFFLYEAAIRSCFLISALCLISITTPLAFLLYLTLNDSGSVGYYAIKQGYIWSYLVNLGIFVLLEQKKFAAWSKKKISDTSEILVVTLIVVGSLIGATNPKYFTGPGMGTLENVIRASFGPKNEWSIMGLDATKILEVSSIASSSSEDCFVYRNDNFYSDLGSRWVNGLSKNKVSNSCFSVYWNSDSLSQIEIGKRIALSDSTVKVLSTKTK